MNSQQPRVRDKSHLRDKDQKQRSSLLWAAARVAVLALCLPLFVWGNPQAQPQAPGTNSPGIAPTIPVLPAVQHVKLLLDNGNPALEIETTAPVIPEINKSNEGMRLVIDLPNTNMSVADKVVPIKNKDLSEMRLNLVGSTPPRVHVEVDFRMPLAYTWNATGNRLLITFREPGKPDASATPAAAASTTPLPVSAPVEIADFTNVVAAERLAPGYAVSATGETTVLRVKRVGDVYICPQTTVSVVRSKNGPDLLLAINSGGLETHLSLKNSADEVVTPDFRILLRGPGDFHYAIRSDSRGNACVKTLPGNTASAIIYEVMGDGSYNVQAQDQLFLHDGKLSPEAIAHSQSNSSGSVLAVECGCPPPARAVLVASNRTEPKLAIEDPSPGPAAPAARRLEVTSDPGPTLPTTPSGSSSQAPPETATEIRELPPSRPNQPHVQVEASLTFTPNPARLAASHLPAFSNQVASPVEVLPPSPPPAPEHKTVLGKIKGFFSRVFQ
ncbi:MAG TPA: AMIN domain-containing protein [Candidatus Sulfotelmatobacter sp.]